MNLGAGTTDPVGPEGPAAEPPPDRRRKLVRVALIAGLTLAPMTALLSIGSAAPLAPPLGPCSGPQCPSPFPPVDNGDFAGRDATVNIFTGGYYRVSGRAAEAEGKIVTMGGFTVDKDGGGSFNAGVVGVGSRVVPPDGTDFVTVGGNVDIKTGNTLFIGGGDSTGIAYGNLKYAGTLTGATDIAPTGAAIQDPNATVPFQDALTQIETVSACTGTAAATGTVTSDGFTVTFQGDGTSARQVFNVPGNLTKADGTAIDLVFAGIPDGATVVVNMLSDNPIINTNTGFDGTPTAALRPRLMWNFPTATTSTITGLAQFQGSVMAGNPANTMTISQAGMNGRVSLAGNLEQTGSGGFELHAYPFDGDLPECAAPSPSPSPSHSPSVTPSHSPSHSPSPSHTTPGGSPTHGLSGGMTSGPSLPSTGSSGNPVMLGLAGAALMAGGGLAVLVARRRGRHS